jgi:hypothetical protein
MRCSTAVSIAPRSATRARGSLPSFRSVTRQRNIFRASIDNFHAACIVLYDDANVSNASFDIFLGTTGQPNGSFALFHGTTAFFHGPLPG